jgi:hypothetical protein
MAAREPLHVERNERTVGGAISLISSDRCSDDACGSATVFCGQIVRRCRAHSKRSGLQCGNPAMHGKHVCRFHGGKSTGPKTEAGKRRAVAAHTVHGQETAAIRAARPAAMKRLAELEGIARAAGMLPSIPHDAV